MSKIKRVMLVKMVVLIIALVVIAAFATPATAASTSDVAPITWRLAAFPGPHAVCWTVFYPGASFEWLVRERSKGRLLVKSNPGLYPTQEQIYAVADGRCEMANGSPAFISGENPLWNPGALPGIVANVNEWLFACNHPTVKEIWDRSYRKKGLVRLASMTTALQYLWAKKPVDTVAKFKGMKIRGSGLDQVMTLELLGASAVASPFEELAISMERGTVDATITGGYWGMASGVWKIAPYVSVWPVTPIWPMDLVANAKAFDALPADLQQILRDVGHEIENIVWGGAIQEDLYPFLVLPMTGGKAIIPNEAEREKALELTKPVYEKWYKRAGPEGRKLVAAIQEAVQKARAGKLAAK